MTDRRRSSSKVRRHLPRAFTLIELLVVIAIIAVLMSILIPVISKVRTAGFDTATTGRMQAIMSAIDAYYQQHKAYPGPLADEELYTTTNPSAKAVKQTNTGSLPAGVTSSENLVLGLMGGAVFPPNTNTLNAVGTLKIDYDPNAVGNGPTNFNILAQGKRYQAYADPKACGLENNAVGPWVAWKDPSHNPPPSNAALYVDTVIPEFVDSFPDPMPILYIRAAGGNTATLSIKGAPTQNNQPAGANDKPVWDPEQLQAYPFPATADGARVQIQNDAYTGKPDPDVKSDFPSPHYYFTMTSDHVTPQQRGGYMLIVAGKDRKYMTRDDRVNGRPVQ